MKPRIGSVTLVVDDGDDAIAYCTGALGSDLIDDVPLHAGKRRVRVAPAGSGTALLLAKAVDDAQAARIGDQTGGRVGFLLETDDFARDHAAVRARGVRFAEAPREEDDGTVAVFLDLYGNRRDLLEPKR